MREGPSRTPIARRSSGLSHRLWFRSVLERDAVEGRHRTSNGGQPPSAVGAELLNPGLSVLKQLSDLGITFVVAELPDFPLELLAGLCQLKAVGKPQDAGKRPDEE